MMLNALAATMLVPAAILCWSVWRRRDVPGAGALLAHTLLSAFWLLTYLLQLDAADPGEAHVWRHVKMLGVVGAPVAWFVFAVHYTGVGGLFTPFRVGALLAVPVTVLALTWTNDRHGLVFAHRADVALTSSSYGPAFGAFVAYAYLLLIVSSVLVVWTLARSSRLYSGQTIALLAAIGLPWGASALYLADLFPGGRVDPTPFAYVLMDVVLGWSIRRRSLLAGAVGLIPHVRDRIVDVLHDGVIVADGHRRVVDLNAAAAQLLNLREDAMLGRAVTDLVPVPAELIDPSRDGLCEIVLGEAPYARALQVRVAPLSFLTASRPGWLLTLAEITARKRTEAALAESEQRYRSAVNGLSEVVFQLDTRRRWRLLNPAWTALTGHVVAEALGNWATLYVHPEDRARDDREVGGLLAGTKTLAHYEIRYVRADGEIRWFEVHARPVYATSGGVDGVAGTLVDITDRKRLQDQLRHQAFHDALTGLANRTLFRERVGHVLDRASTIGGTHAVIFLDLDDFKKVNDSLGHAIGDNLLRAVAARLVGCVRSSDTVARLGGDEFAVLLEDLADGHGARLTADRILDALRAPFSLDGRDVVVGASLGIAPIVPAARNTDMLLRDADIAMYAAKRRGRGRAVTFAEGMDTAAQERLELESALQRAIDGDELVVCYQPILDVRTGRIVGAEALVRWRHPERGLLGPAEFISIAEETGSIVPIGRRVLGRACADLRRWQERDPSRAALSVSVNLSARQFQAEGLIDDVVEILHETRLRPDRLIFEITETVAMQNTEATIERLAALKALGVRLAIDDFGTGYSSLSYLQRFPIDILKIDRAFVQGIAQNTDDEALARTIVQLARTLRLVTIAEGIESVRQLERLRAIGCDYGQGYYFARPTSADQVDLMLTAEGRPAAVGAA